MCNANLSFDKPLRFFSWYKWDLIKSNIYDFIISNRVKLSKEQIHSIVDNMKNIKIDIVNKLYRDIIYLLANHNKVVNLLNKDSNNLEDYKNNCNYHHT